MDRADSTDSLNLKQSDNNCQTLNVLANSSESIVLESKDDIRKDAELPVGSSSAILEQAEKDHQQKLLFDVNPDVGDWQQGGFDGPSSLFSKLEFDLSEVLVKQYCENSVTEDAQVSNLVVPDCNSHILPESKHSNQAHEDYGDKVEVASSEPAENIKLNEFRASQHQRGMHRRCLQFKDAQQEMLVNNYSSWNPSKPATNSSSPCRLADLDVLESSYLEIPVTAGSIQLADDTQTESSMFSSRDNRNPSTTISKPAGIGLHLNSIVAAMPLDSGVTSSVQSVNKGSLTVKGNNNLSVMGHRVSEDKRNCLTSSDVTVNVLVSTKDSRNESNSLATEKSNSEFADGDKECNQSSIGKKRKKTSSTSSGVDCKRCNCKKTKCLKLYCDCFAAGIYCAEPCACQECFNRPDYEDTVSETRQQIESRNPLAFAPKIIQRVPKPPATSSREDINHSTPFSARHKRGCNCKRSMCLKKYCECYQAGVGCSNGCRCERCKNVYGRKEEYGLNKDVVSSQDIDGGSEDLFDDKLDLGTVKDDLLQNVICNPQNLTPFTPSFQCSDHRMNVSRSRFLPGRYLISPESDPTFLAPYGRSQEAPRNFNNQEIVAENRKDALGFVSFNEELNYGNAGAVDQFSPACHGNMGNLTALAHPSLTMASLMSPKEREHENGSAAQLFSGSGCSPSQTSLHLDGSPTTSMTQFVGNKLLQLPDPNNRLDDIMEDETPDILKYDSTPPNTVKTSSPNKKRISPPKGHLSEIGSSSSTGLRIARKFILQAVPSFPPLTPCIDLKSSDNQNQNDSQDHCSSK